MSNLSQEQTAQGAVLAPDGIPLHFGSVEDEYHAALNQSVLMDRSHEGRVLMTGTDRLEIMHRISTNDLYNMQPNEGRPTVFTKANARIIDRVVVYNRDEDTLLLTEPGRGEAMAKFLQRKIFFDDDAQLKDITAESHQFVLHGPQSDAVMTALGVDTNSVPAQFGTNITLAGAGVFAARRKPLSHTYWSLNVFDADKAAAVWNAILEAGKPAGLVPAGGLAYNMLRIRAGRPAFGRELSKDYIPLEVGLWDEVSFTKGCYTGQEIIARMESRHRIAKVMVRLQLDDMVQAPADLLRDGKRAGTLTSSVRLATGGVVGIGVVKAALAEDGKQLQTEDGVGVEVVELAAAPPPETMLS